MIAPLLLATAFTTAPLGGPVADLARTHGLPAAVVAQSDGNRFAFPHGDGGAFDAYVDDDARVRALDVRGGTNDAFAVEIEGTPHTFAFASYTAADAESQLSAYADTTADGVRTYRLTPTRELVLGFDRAGRLVRVVVGERTTVARLGYLPGLGLDKAVPYGPPKLRATRVPDATGAHAVVVRESLDRRGDAVTADVVVSSGDAAFDAKVVHAARDDHWHPATLGGRAIGATVFREVRG